MNRSIVYPVAGASGFLIGALIGVDGRNCSHPEQPPFLQCVTEDPPDILLPAIALALLAMAVVAAVDLALTSSRRSAGTQIPPWRRWLYAGLLAVTVFPAAKIAIEQAVGGYSDGDPISIFVVGVWVLTPVILVEFIVWVMRQFQGVQRLVPVLVLTAVGAVAYFGTSDPDLACVRHSLDNVSCYEGMQLYITNYLILCAMVGAFFLPMRASEKLEEAVDSAEPLRR